jgi:outer membrane beta-barrel protein
MKARTLTVWLLAAVAAASPAAGRASDADAFEDRAKPVSGQLYQKAGKIELTLPSAQLSLNDAFFSKYMAGAKLGYHFTEYLSAAVTGSGGLSSATGSTSLCRANQGCTAATPEQLNQLPGQIRWIVGAELAFAPIYGKLNIFAEKTIHFDLGVMGGADLVSYRDVLGAADAASGATPGNATTIGGHVGVGARVFFAGFMALRLELKDLVYSVSHLPNGNLQSQLLADVGLSFFFPVAHGSAP